MLPHVSNFSPVAAAALTDGLEALTRIVAEWTAQRPARVA